MNFWDELKNHFNISLLLPLAVGSVFTVAFQSFQALYGQSGDDLQRILTQAMVFFATLTIGGAVRFYFFYALGKKTNQIKARTFTDFISQFFVEWVIVEVRIQLRTLSYLLLLIVPGVIEALRLSISPIHVFFNPKMEQDDFDPIHTSRNTLNSKETKTLLILFLINFIILGLQLSLVGGSFFSGGVEFFKALLCIPIITFTSYFYYIYIYHLYLHYSKLNKIKSTQNLK